MTICSERWLGLGLSLDVRSESNHAFSGIHLFVSCMSDGFQRACLCRGKFLFLNPGRVLSPLEPVLGEITGLSLITGLSVVFSSCRAGALQVCETRRPGPPSRIADPGLFWGDFPDPILSQRALLCREGLRSCDFLAGNGFGNGGW